MTNQRCGPPLFCASEQINPPQNHRIKRKKATELNRIVSYRIEKESNRENILRKWANSRFRDPIFLFSSLHLHSLWLFGRWWLDLEPRS